MTLEQMQNMLDAALREAGAAPASFSTGGMAEVQLHGLRLALEYAAREERLHLWCSLGTLPADPPASLCEFLLECSLLGGGTAGGHIGLYAPTRTLIYSQSFEAAALDGSRLASALARFTEKAVQLMAETEEQGFSATSAPLPFMPNAIWA
ncbi:type III secretion system chaperone [Mailhella sp.]|uniref:type III secretion system chaperone n=1 Tax=Mailhella sp. TaxID=1981029 RepID=UPI004064B8F4